MTILIVFVTFIVGIVSGVYGHSCYANHLYMEHPEFFRNMLDYKLLRKRGFSKENAVRTVWYAQEIKESLERSQKGKKPHGLS